MESLNEMLDNSFTVAISVNEIESEYSIDIDLLIESSKLKISDSLSVAALTKASESVTESELLLIYSLTLLNTSERIIESASLNVTVFKIASARVKLSDFDKLVDLTIASASVIESLLERVIT